MAGFAIISSGQLDGFAGPASRRKSNRASVRRREAIRCSFSMTVEPRARCKRPSTAIEHDELRHARTESVKAHKRRCVIRRRETSARSRSPQGRSAALLDSQIVNDPGFAGNLLTFDTRLCRDDPAQDVPDLVAVPGANLRDQTAMIGRNDIPRQDRQRSQHDAEMQSPAWV